MSTKEKLLSESDNMNDVLARASRNMDDVSGMAPLGGDLGREILMELRRIANHFDPPPPDIVGTDYVANKLGCTITWISMQLRDGEIPLECVVAGTGNGKPWRLYRSKIDVWIQNR
jgi:hypothetical protein